MLVFKLDPYEQNNSLPSATHMGAGATLNVDPTIDPPGFMLAQQQIPGDEDWYRFVAAETGVLDFQVYFREVTTLLNGRAGLPGNGTLTVQVYDSDGLPGGGNPLGVGSPLMDPAGNTIGRHVSIPVVRNQVYNMRVFGTTFNSINVYNFSVINVPTPIPQQVDLTAATDSGRSDTDDITFFDANLHGAAVFDIILDDDRLDEFNNLNLLPDTVNDDLATPGFDYGVQVFNNGVSIGFAFLVSNNTWRFTATAGDLIEGHNNFVSAAVWVRDRATPAVLSRGDLSRPLQVTLDTIAPANPTILIDPATSDTGVAAFPATIADRVTSDAATGFLGRAEADTIVRLWADGEPVSLGTINASDVFQGLTVAEPLDGDEAFPNGQWDLTPRFDLNDPSVGFPLDGFRQITATAEDIAGNESSRAAPRCSISSSTRKDRKSPPCSSPRTRPSTCSIPSRRRAPTPLVNQLSIAVRDLPNRSNIDPNFLYDALAHNPGHDNDPAEDPGNYLLRGDHNGVIPIKSVQFIPDIVVNGAAGHGHDRAHVLRAAARRSLHADRSSDSLVDPAGNQLDGESNAIEPQEDPFFPSGDGAPGGDFVARFTVDSRPEIGVWAAGSVYVDTNGNFTFDPHNLDFTNRDITYVLRLHQRRRVRRQLRAESPATWPTASTSWRPTASVERPVPLAGRHRQRRRAERRRQVDPAGINGVPVAGNFDGNDRQRRRSGPVRRHDLVLRHQPRLQGRHGRWPATCAATRSSATSTATASTTWRTWQRRRVLRSTWPTACCAAGTDRATRRSASASSACASGRWPPTWTRTASTTSACGCPTAAVRRPAKRRVVLPHFQRLPRGNSRGRRPRPPSSPSSAPSTRSTIPSRPSPLARTSTRNSATIMPCPWSATSIPRMRAERQSTTW